MRNNFWALVLAAVAMSATAGLAAWTITKDPRNGAVVLVFCLATGAAGAALWNALLLWLGMSNAMKEAKSKEPAAPLPKPDSFFKRPPVMFNVAWSDSCDNCIYQEGRHHCLLHQATIYNMDAQRCTDWKDKYADNSKH